MKEKITGYKVFVHIFFILYSLICILPFLLIIGISFSEQNDIIRYGYSLIPRTFTTIAYEVAFQNPQSIIDSYAVTAISAFGGTIVGIVSMAMCGYALAKNDFFYKKIINAMIVITMFFSGGIAPAYIINTQLFHLNNNIIAYLVLGTVSAYYIFCFRTFFKQIPYSLIESAQLDGANEPTILFKIMLPMSKAMIATFGFLILISRWNSYDISLYYMTDSRLYQLQYYLQMVLRETEFIAKMMQNMPGSISTTLPTETLKFALCIIAAGPMIFVFPFFQKYFAKGMVAGSVKG